MRFVSLTIMVVAIMTLATPSDAQVSNSSLQAAALMIPAEVKPQPITDEDALPRVSTTQVRRDVRTSDSIEWCQTCCNCKRDCSMGGYFCELSSSSADGCRSSELGGCEACVPDSCP